MVAAILAGSVIGYPALIVMTLMTIRGGASAWDAESAWLLMALFIQAAYYSVTVSRTGQTPGKTFMGIRVLSSKGNIPSLRTAIQRWFGCVLSSLALNIGFVLVAIQTKKLALHDRLAGTRVEETTRRVTPIRIAIAASLLPLALLPLAFASLAAVRGTHDAYMWILGPEEEAKREAYATHFRGSEFPDRLANGRLVYRNYVVRELRDRGEDWCLGFEIADRRDHPEIPPLELCNRLGRCFRIDADHLTSFRGLYDHYLFSSEGIDDVRVLRIYDLATRRSAFETRFWCYDAEMPRIQVGRHRTLTFWEPRYVNDRYFIRECVLDLDSLTVISTGKGFFADIDTGMRGE